MLYPLLIWRFLVNSINAQPHHPPVTLSITSGMEFCLTDGCSLGLIQSNVLSEFQSLFPRASGGMVQDASCTPLQLGISRFASSPNLSPAILGRVGAGGRIALVGLDGAAVDEAAPAAALETGRGGPFC